VASKGQAIGMGLATLVTGLLLIPRKNSNVVDSTSPPSSTADGMRARVVEIAKGEIGQQDPAKYWEGVLSSNYSAAQIQQYAASRAWCGGFALWCIKRAGLAPDINWVDGKGFCYQLSQTTDPKPGDVAYFDQPYQHHAIVADVTGNILSTVDGNQSHNQVLARIRRVSDATAFYSIESLIRKAV
jgi:uncharacterized protein YfaT (DUF1175 family)